MRVVNVGAGEGDWDAFVRTRPDATHYHQFGWRRVMADGFGHKCHYLAAVDDDGKWCGVLPLVQVRSAMFGNFLVSVPFVNYGGLLCTTAMAREALLDEAVRIRNASGAAHVELRHIERVLDGVPTRQHKVTMILDLAGDVDAQWKVFNAKLRNQIRKAEKSGLRTQFGSLDLLDVFYDVYARNMRDLGTPVYGKAFFLSVLRTFPETTRVVAVFLGATPVAAGIAVWHGTTVEMPWASSVGDYRQLCPNNQLYWDAIRLAIESGFARFDFGRSTPGEGTYNFKKQWGARPIQMHWQYLLGEGQTLPDLSPSNPKFSAAIRVWQKLPVPVTKLLGPMIVRNIP